MTHEEAVAQRGREMVRLKGKAAFNGAHRLARIEKFNAAQERKKLVRKSRKKMAKRSRA